ncbi:hypothetical protein [Lentzea sp.]
MVLIAAKGIPGASPANSVPETNVTSAAPALLNAVAKTDIGWACE